MLMQFFFLVLVSIKTDGNWSVAQYIKTRVFSFWFVLIFKQADVLGF